MKHLAWILLALVMLLLAWLAWPRTVAVPGADRAPAAGPTAAAPSMRADPLRSATGNRTTTHENQRRHLGDALDDGSSSVERATTTLRGSLRESLGEPCRGVAIHRVVRGDGHPARTAPPAGATARRLGETAADGGFAIEMQTPLADDEWLEFELGEAGFARYRPRELAGEHVLLVPRRIETSVELVGLDPDEGWYGALHPVQRTADGEAVEHGCVDVPLPSPHGELLLR